MKTVLLFSLFFLIGISIVGGYQYFTEFEFATPVKVPAIPSITTHFSLQNAPSESIKGTIASMSGKVKWLSRVADKPILLHKPRTIQQGEALSTGKNSKAIVMLKNYSLLVMAPKTDVNFIQLLPVNFVIKQDKGEVTYTNALLSPISVRSFGLVTIIGKGVMHVAVNDKEKTVRVTVEKGSVTEGFEDQLYNSNVTTVKAGQIYTFDDKTKKGTLSQIPGFVAPQQLPFGH